MMNKQLEQKLATLPREPGVYFHKDSMGTIMYVGKAAVLRNRVRQYFQASRSRDAKTEALVKEIYDTDWMVVESELEALFLEAEMIRRYMPRYNILLRDDKAMSYIRIDLQSNYPTVTTTRRPLDDGAQYYGPYFSTTSVRQALKILRKIFPFATHKPMGKQRASLQYHLGLDPGLDEGKTSLGEYRKNLRKMIAVIQGKRTGVIVDLEKEMKRAAKNQAFEEAARLRNQVLALQSLGKQVIFSDKEFLDISKDHALAELVELLGLKKFPKRIEGYDISHMQGSDVVASMVVFTNGVSDKGQYRKFKTHREQNNDFFSMNETIARRLTPKNVSAWVLPNLFLIDGGKGQLDAAIQARDAAGYEKIPMIGLAKREEQIVIKAATRLDKSFEGSTAGSSVVLNQDYVEKLGGHTTTSADYVLINLPHSTNVIKLLQRIRDESHRFAVTYHGVLKTKRQTSSLLDDIPTIGPHTKKKLLRTFGSVRGVTQARDWELARVVGDKKAAILRQYLRPHRRDFEASPSSSPE